VGCRRGSGSGSMTVDLRPSHALAHHQHAQRAPSTARGVELSFEVGSEYRDPATGDAWIDYPVAGSAAWSHRAANGVPFDARAQRGRDANRVQRVLATGAVGSRDQGAWRVLADWARSTL